MFWSKLKNLFNKSKPEAGNTGAAINPGPDRPEPEAISDQPEAICCDEAGKPEVSLHKPEDGKVEAENTIKAELEAERKMGEMLAQTERAQGRRSDLIPAGDEVETPTLKDLGITLNESSAAQMLASIPQAEFEKVKSGELTKADQEVTGKADPISSGGGYKGRYRSRNSYKSKDPELRRRQLANLPAFQKDPTYFPRDFNTLDIITFAERFIILDNGKRLVLEDFQKQILTAIFSIKDGRHAETLLYNIALCLFPRKNGKSTLSAMIALYYLFCKNETEITSIANDKEQAAIIFNKTAKFIKRNPTLRRQAKTRKDFIEVGENTYRVREADAVSLYGEGSEVYLYDELGWARDRKIFDCVSTSQGHIKNPLIVITSTAGEGQEGLLFELYQRALTGQDKKLYMFYSNENKASWIKPEYLAEQKDRLPDIVYQRLHENRFVSGSGSFVTQTMLNRCFVKDLNFSLTGKPGINYVMGLDIGLVKDRSCLCLSSRQGDLIYLDFMRVFEGDKENPVLLADIRESVFSLLKTFNVTKIVIDKWQAQFLLQELIGKGFPVEDFNFTSGTLHKISTNLFNLIRQGQLKMPGDPDLEKELLQLRAINTNFGWKLDHTSKGFSDRAISLGMSVLYSLQEQENIEKPFEVIAGSVAEMFEAVDGEASESEEAIRGFLGGEGSSEDFERCRKKLDFFF